MTLKDLKARTARAYKEARAVPQSIGKPRFHGLNMRQAWVANTKVIKAFLDLGEPTSMVIPKALKTFHNEGEIYSHAKEHGIASAVLLRLNRI